MISRRLLAVLAGVLVVTAALAGGIATAQPAETPADQRSPDATYGPGTTEIDVSGQDWIYVELYGAQGGDGGDGSELYDAFGGTGGSGGYVSGWLNVSGVDTLESYIPQQGETDGYHDGQPGDGAEGGSGGNGAGAAAIVIDGQAAMVAGGGGGGGGGSSCVTGANGGDGGSGGEVGNTGGSGGSGATCQGEGDPANSDPGSDGGPGSGEVDSSLVEYGETATGENTGDAQIAVYEGPQVSNPIATNLEYDDGEISVDVADPDFGEPWGDTVSVTVENDSGVVFTDTVSANGTVAHQTELSGIQELTATVEDAVGHTDSDGPITVYGSGTVEIRDEATLDLINDTTVSVEAHPLSGDGDIVGFDTSNGQLDISGLNPEFEYVFLLDAQNYHTRTVFLGNIYDQEAVYMLSEANDSVPVTFTLDDQTGSFPEGTSQLQIEKSILLDGERRWRVVTGDEFGVGGVGTNLMTGGRYRLRVRNGDGDERLLGSYTPTNSEFRELTVGSITWTVGDPEAERLTWDALYFDDGQNEEFVRFSLEDDTDDLEDVDVAIFEQGNRSNELHSSTNAGPYGTLSIVEGPLTASQRNATWVVEWEAQRNGETLSGRTIVGSGEYPVGTSLDGRGLQFVAVLLIVFIAGFFPAAFAAIGAVVVGLVGLLLWSIGWLNLPLSWVLAALAVGAIARGVKTGGFQS